MGKFKVGDKVRVRKDLVVDETYDYCFFTRGMEQFKGKILTITKEPLKNRYYAKESGSWHWAEEMFEDINKPEYLVNIARIARNKETTIVFWNDGSKTIVRLGENQIDNQEMTILWAYFEKNSGLTKTKAHKVMEDLINNIYQQDKTKIKISSEKGTIKIGKLNGTITASKIVLPKESKQ